MKKLMLGVLILIPIIVVLTIGLVANFVSVMAYIAVESVTVENDNIELERTLSESDWYSAAELYELMGVKVLPERATNKDVEITLSGITPLDPEITDVGGDGIDDVTGEYYVRLFGADKETVVSLGHTSCDYDTARRAFDAGARHLTHLYNAMPEFCHRNPGPIGAALDTPECMVELIADGIHSHDSAIRAAFTLFADRIVLISDSMRAVGLSDGSYTLGGQDVLVKGHLATLSDGTIAGSCTNLYDCMRHVVSAGIPVEKAVAAATANPARSIGIYDEAGSIAPGKRADLLLTAPDLTLRAVL